jgi:hypothetical protein
MASLTNVDLDTDFAEMPSVLALFGSSGEHRQAGLTG